MAKEKETNVESYELQVNTPLDALLVYRTIGRNCRKIVLQEANQDQLKIAFEKGCPFVVKK